MREVVAKFGVEGEGGNSEEEEADEEGADELEAAAPWRSDVFLSVHV